MLMRCKIHCAKVFVHGGGAFVLSAHFRSRVSFMPLGLVRLEKAYCVISDYRNANEALIGKISILGDYIFIA